MTKYPNRAALYEAHNIYRDAMRPFIVRCLKRVRGERVEDLIRDSLPDPEVEQFESDLQKHNGNIEAAMDSKHFPHIIGKYWHWDRAFSQQFDSNSKIQYKTGTIADGRNLWAHPGVEDLNSDRTQADLTYVAEVLGEIGNREAKEAVETIRDQLFSDEVEEHPAEVENAALKENLADMTKQLDEAKAEKTELEKQIKTKSDRLTEMEREWLASEERLEEAEVENAELKKCLSEAENRLRTVESERDEHIKTLTEQPRTVEAEKTILEERPKNLPKQPEIKEWRRKIWKQLCDYAAQKDTPVRFHKPGSENYLNVSRSLIALTGFNMKVWLGRDNREIAIRLYMSKQNFYILEKQRKEIEQEFCESLEWEKLPQRSDSRISLRKDIIDPTDESDWQNQHEWVISKLEKFHKKFNEVFLPRIQELNTSNSLSEDEEDLPLNTATLNEVVISPEDFESWIEDEEPWDEADEDNVFSNEVYTESQSYSESPAKSPKYQRKWRRPGAVAALRDPAEIQEAEAKIANILNPREKTRLERELREAKRAVDGF